MRSSRDTVVSRTGLPAAPSCSASATSTCVLFHNTIQYNIT